MMCVVAVIIIVLSSLLNSINKDEENTIIQKAVFDECERVAHTLLLDSKYVEHKDKLTKIYDEIKYSDHISDYKSSDILSVLNSISLCIDESEVNRLCDQVIQLIQDRNITVKQLKRGGF